MAVVAWIFTILGIIYGLLIAGWLVGNLKFWLDEREKRSKK
jgi:hypothetical protein